jgi:hypothetical protein
MPIGQFVLVAGLATHEPTLEPRPPAHERGFAVNDIVFLLVVAVRSETDNFPVTTFRCHRTDIRRLRRDAPNGTDALRASSVNDVGGADPELKNGPRYVPDQAWRR